MLRQHGQGMTMETAEAVLETAAVTDMIGVRLIAKRMVARVSSRRCARGPCLAAAAAAANTRLSQALGELACWTSTVTWDKLANLVNRCR
jgi:hypothetical protein